MWRITEASYAILRPILLSIDAERAHRITLASLARIPAMAPSADPPELHTTVFGVSFSNPVGLAAGADKDARAVAAWNTLGFGFAEIGTITPRPQAGNPPPRMWRIPEHRALINRLGFPGEGMEAVAPRIERARGRMLRMRIGLNFGPNKDRPPELVAADYAALMGRLGGLADFVVVNLSSPNTPGLREFQAPERIRAIVEAIRAEGEHAPPLLVKIAPDLEPPMLREIGAAAIELSLGGIVATNTTLKREEVGMRSNLEGGLSGEPLRARAREVIAQVYSDTRGRIPIIGAGGIMNAEDAYAHIRAGASLVELYTGFVYGGPRAVREIREGLPRLLARDGFRSISDAVGSAA
ncbi:MAG TPA: quinone-dependent dihydroorotate dehydrogenase [Candidatus Binataceae bacterium]|nr:quinone-dependent dihydroorotate dehydrogenase [Candidatus Binataceae bacterium]